MGGWARVLRGCREGDESRAEGGGSEWAVEGQRRSGKRVNSSILECSSL